MPKHLPIQEKAIAEALNIFVQSGFISKIEAEEDEAEEMQEVVYSLKEEKRLNLEYYKNNILHFFVPLVFCGYIHALKAMKI